MKRIRTIKPELPESESIGRLSRDARLLFIQMLTIADDEGRMRGTPKLIASQLYPYDDDVPDFIDGWLAEVERESLILRYEVAGGKYILITGWKKHQKIDRPSASKLPGPDEALPNTHRGLAECSPKPREPSATDQDQDQDLEQDLDLEREHHDPLPPAPSMFGQSAAPDNPPVVLPRGGHLLQQDFAAWWDLYDKKVGKVVAEKDFRVALNKTDVGTIMRATRRYVEAEPRQHFRKDPERWLKQERWLDETAISDPRHRGDGVGRPGKPEAFGHIPMSPDALYLKRYRAGEIDEAGNELRPAAAAANDQNSKIIEGELA